MLVSSCVTRLEEGTRRLIKHTSHDSSGSRIEMLISDEENNFMPGIMQGSMVR
jgi:hypothetical protein